MGLSKLPRIGMPRLMAFCCHWNLSFVRCKSDPNVYLKLIHGYLMIIVLYVDELLITGSLKKEFASLKDAMNHAFSMTNLGLLSQFLGLEIAQSQHGIKVHQSKYASYFLKKFSMKYCKPSKTPFLSKVKLEH